MADANGGIEAAKGLWSSAVSAFTGIWALVFVTIIVGLIIVAIIVGCIIYYFVDKKKFNKKVVIFEKVNGKIEPIGQFKAALLNIGNSGDKMLFVKKIKIFLPNPSIQTGRNIFWFYLREDREYINIGIEDIDEKMKKMGANFLDKEMRYARVALYRSLQERYQKIGFWEKYGGLITWAIFILISGIGFWFLLIKEVQVANTFLQISVQQEKVLDTLTRLLSAMDNLNKTGSLTFS